MDKEFFIHFVIHSAYSCLTTLISIVLLEILYKNIARVKANIYSHPQSQLVPCPSWFEE